MKHLIVLLVALHVLPLTHCLRQVDHREWDFDLNKVGELFWCSGQDKMNDCGLSWLIDVNYALQIDESSINPG